MWDTINKHIPKTPHNGASQKEGDLKICIKSHAGIVGEIAEKAIVA